MRVQRPCVAFEGPLRIRDGAARKGPMRTRSCWGQPEFKILRLATLGDDGVEVDFVPTWMISRPFCARRSVEPIRAGSALLALTVTGGTCQDRDAPRAGRFPKPRLGDHSSY
jgi:hypothetical protein